MRTMLICIAVVGCVGWFGACNNRSAPAAPSSLPPQSPPPTALTTASLVIERLSIKVSPKTPGDKYGYEPRFQLREASGNSGATIQNIAVLAPNGDGDNTGPGCWRDTLRVPPAAVLDTFYSDAGASRLGYCAPWSSGNSETPDLRVVVTFTDDGGHVGTVQERATTLR